MKNYTIEIKWAFRFTLLILAWAIGEKFAGFHDIHIDNYFYFDMLFAFPAVLFYILALKEKKKYFFNNEINWTQGFISGMALSVFITLLMPFALYVIYTSVSPNFFENIIQYKTENSKTAVDTLQKTFNMKSFIFSETFSALSKGIITGALISFFIRTKK